MYSDKSNKLKDQAKLEFVTLEISTGGNTLLVKKPFRVLLLNGF